MTVRAKFKVESVTAREDGATVKLVPVTTSGARASAENARFCKYTPAGEISLTTINLDAAAQFKPGAEMFVDFHNIDPHTGEPV
jgi:hypothetical protein